LIDGQTDGQKNSFLIAKPRLHSMQRGKKDEILAVVRCQILKLKSTQIDFVWGSPQTRLGELTAFPQIL